MIKVIVALKKGKRKTSVATYALKIGLLSSAVECASISSSTIPFDQSEAHSEQSGLEPRQAFQGHFGG